ncbi:MAG TPA: TauD/TfdA family dioxygenase [Kofleriaceae bacterium]|nr:TauD/TfdA family dioxygenase [Kofleriaceae bacterium]
MTFDGARADFVAEGHRLPLRLTPTRDALARDPAAFVAWYAEQRGRFEAALDEHAAVLFRGFALPDTADFQRVIALYPPHAPGYIAGATPRKVIEGQVYESTRMPAPFKIGLHQEKAYMAQFPRLIAFYCKLASEAGGETPLADMRGVLRRLAPAVLERFRARGVMYRRNFFDSHEPPGAPAPSHEYHRPWREAFETDDRAEVEARCRDRGLAYEWLADGSVTVSHVGPATLRHPRTGAEVWFNQAAAQHVNPRALGDFSFRVLSRKYDKRIAFPYEIRFGDGSAMSRADLDPVYDALDAEERAFPWQPGDLLLVDNVLASHGRMPFKGKRDIQVAMMD